MYVKDTYLVGLKTVMLTFKHVNLKLNISKWNLTLSDQASNRDCEMGGGPIWHGNAKG